MFKTQIKSKKEKKRKEKKQDRISIKNATYKLICNRHDASQYEKYLIKLKQKSNQQQAYTKIYNIY